MSIGRAATELRWCVEGLTLPWWKLLVRVAVSGTESLDLGRGSHRSNQLCLKTVLQVKQFIYGPLLSFQKTVFPSLVRTAYTISSRIKTAHPSLWWTPWVGNIWHMLSQHVLVKLNLVLDCRRGTYAWFPLGEFSPFLIFRFFVINHHKGKILFFKSIWDDRC